MTHPFHIETLDPARVAPEEYAALNTFENAMLAERAPDDPPLTLEQTTGMYASIPSFVSVQAWCVRDAGRLVAFATVAMIRLEQNAHIADARVEVLPEYRRRGIGRALFERVVRAAHDDGRRLLLLNTTDRVAGAATVVARTGAQAGLTSRVSQLDVTKLDTDLLDGWVTRAKERAGAYDLGFWNGAYPEEHDADVAELMCVMNTAPRDDLDMEDWTVTPDLIRDMERQHAASGRKRITAYVQHRDTGRFVGYSELTWHPAREGILSQGATAVHPDARGLGLGRWLKAAVLRRVLTELHEARYVRTTNAESNASMLGINVELGFRPYSATTVWQLPVTDAQAYLAAAPTA